MICAGCGGSVEWKGPLSALTHTECEACGAIDNQEPETAAEEELEPPETTEEPAGMTTGLRRHKSSIRNAIDVDALAQEIRRLDGSHNLGAGALAEALMPFIEGLTQ